jgi:hypothetical protein
MDFRELADERQRVREICRSHVPSLSAFKYSKGPSFKLTWDEDKKEPGKIHLHLTSTATCIESLEDCHPTVLQSGSLKEIADAVRSNESGAIETLTNAFYAAAYKKPAKEWRSEGSAPVYCVGRALPLFLKGTTIWTRKHTRLVSSIYEQLTVANRFGIGEKKLEPATGKGRKWYPENTYHTYWALKVFHILRHGNFAAQVPRVLGPHPDRLWEGMRLWARAKLAEEVGLHWANSAMLDSDQLAWALTTFIEFESDLSSDLRSQDLVRKAFDALASTQEGIGTWRHYRPLFVYSNIGNAYCYVYETFTFLLKAVLARIDTQEFLEDVMLQFVVRLRKLREYAVMTQVRHRDQPDAVAWSSGHRPGDPEPEGWATASVFSFLQAYRRLLGVLTRRRALRELPRIPLLKDKNPLARLKERGDTWSSHNHASQVAFNLVTLFVNPVRLGAPVRSSVPEPDDQPIETWQARSAILFGPPGTSKTTLARSVAAALNWHYVELYSSHFVAQGIEAIQRTADRIFGFLMELDHTVVLFDEPDELVREREDSPDAFGRFLTTSMLPKLAQLWNQRRVIYFVATNHINYFDAAITRSERFDLVLFVPPPSFTKKRHQLKKCLADRGAPDVSLKISARQIDDVLESLTKLVRNKQPSGEALLPRDAQLAKFVLLRFDQMDELASLLAPRPGRRSLLTVDSEQLTEALINISDNRLSKLQTYVDYLRHAGYARRDFQRKPVFSVRPPVPDRHVEKKLVRVGKQLYLPCKSGDWPELAGYNIERTTNPGEVKIIRSRR